LFCRPASLRSSLRQCGVGLIARLPSPYPSSRFAGLGNGLGYFLLRLTALPRREGWVVAASGSSFGTTLQSRIDADARL